MVDESAIGDSTQVEQGTEEWRAKRRGRVTGSIVGAILGLDPNLSRKDAMRAMVRDWHGVEEEINPFTKNVIFTHGKFHEEGARIEYEMETGKDVTQCGFFKYEDWLGASPDGLTFDMFGNLLNVNEIKCPWGKRKDESPEFKPVAELPHYYAQMQIEMLCVSQYYKGEHDNPFKCDFYQWAPRDTSLVTVQFDPKWIKKTLPKLRKFYERYLIERAKDPNPHLVPKRIEVDNIKADKLITEYDELTEAIELATDRKKDIVDQLVKLCNGKDAIVCGRNLTKVEKDGQIKYASVVKDHAPDVDLEPYRGEPSTYWQLK